MNSAKQRRFWLISALILVVAGLGLGCLQAEVELTCDRTRAEGLCQLVQSSVIQREATQFPLAELQRAELQERRQRGSEPTHRVILQTDRAAIPLTAYLASDLISPYAEKAAIVTRLNQFIDTPEQPSVTVRLDDRWFFQIGALTLMVAGVVFGILGWRTQNLTEPLK